jgi:hypothetical protein
MWWRGLLEEGLERQKTKLVHTRMDESDHNRVRGIIQGIEQVLRELDTMAANLAAFDDKTGA